jgi:preprotein translocase subunit YajC
MEMASDDLPFSIAVFLFLFVIFMYWVVSGGKKKEKKNSKVKRDAEGGEEKRFTPRSDTLDGS